MTRSAFVCSVVMLLSACSEGDGTAPEISNLSFEPEAIPAGQQADVDAFFDFSDPDGDVETVEVALQAGGQTQMMDVELMGGAGMTEGTAQVLLRLTAQAPLPLGVDIVAIDAAGLRSNTLSGAIEDSGMAGDPCVEGSCTELELHVEDAFVVY